MAVIQEEYSDGSDEEPDYAYNLLNTIKTKEESFLDHVRTAGLRKPREVSIIEEFQVLCSLNHNYKKFVSGKLDCLRNSRAKLNQQLELEKVNNSVKLRNMENSLSENVNNWAFEKSRMLNEFEERLIAVSEAQTAELEKEHRKNYNLEEQFSKRLAMETNREKEQLELSFHSQIVAKENLIRVECQQYTRSKIEKLSSRLTVEFKSNIAQLKRTNQAMLVREQEALSHRDRLISDTSSMKEEKKLLELSLSQSSLQINALQAELLTKSRLLDERDVDYCRKTQEMTDLHSDQLKEIDKKVRDMLTRRDEKIRASEIRYNIVVESLKRAEECMGALRSDVSRRK